MSLSLDKIKLKYKTTYVNINNAPFFIILNMVNSLKLLQWNFGWMKLLLEPRYQCISARGSVTNQFVFSPLTDFNYCAQSYKSFASCIPNNYSHTKKEVILYKNVVE